MSFPRQRRPDPDLLQRAPDRAGRMTRTTSTRRRYLDVPNAPQYPFGYGLSYTTFSISNVQPVVGSVSRERDHARSPRTVTNTGSRAGTDVAQLYLHESDTSILQPVRKLEGFQRVSLDAGTVADGHVHARTAELRLLQQQGQFVVEPGPFDVWVGDSSAAVGVHARRSRSTRDESSRIAAVARRDRRRRRSRSRWPAGAGAARPAPPVTAADSDGAAARDRAGHVEFYGADVDPVTHLPLDNLGPGSVRGTTRRRRTSACTCGRSSPPTTSG